MPESPDVRQTVQGAETTPLNVQQTLQGAETSTPPRDAPSGDPSLRTRAGIRLTWCVLIMMGAYVVIAYGYLLCSEWQICKTLVGTTLAENLIRECETQRESLRKFWTQSVQMILLNAMLPVLTALLGYVFGTQEQPSSE